MVTIEHILENKFAQKVDFWGCQMGLFIRYLLEALLTNSTLARFPKWAKSITTCMRKTLVPHMCFEKKINWPCLKWGVGMLLINMNEFEAF